MTTENDPTHPTPPDHDQAYALLIFDADDAVRAAEIFRAPKKAVAMQFAMSRVATHPDIVGYQLWQDGSKVAEFFPERHRAASWMVGGPLAARRTNKN